MSRDADLLHLEPSGVVEDDPEMASRRPSRPRRAADAYLRALGSVGPDADLADRSEDEFVVDWAR